MPQNKPPLQKRRRLADNICIAVVAIAFALGWNAKTLHVLHAIDRVLDMLDKSITEKEELSETEFFYVHGMLRTIDLLQERK